MEEPYDFPRDSAAHADLIRRATAYVVDGSRFGRCDECGDYAPDDLNAWHVVVAPGRQFLAERLCSPCLRARRETLAVISTWSAETLAEVLAWARNRALPRPAVVDDLPARAS